MEIKRVFFTPIVYEHEHKTPLQKFTEVVDDYFYYGGERFHLKGTSAKRVIEPLTPAQKALCVLKFVSLFFVFVPVFFYVSKLIVNPRDSLTGLYTDPTEEGFTMLPDRPFTPIRSHAFASNMPAASEELTTTSTKASTPTDSIVPNGFANVVARDASIIDLTLDDDPTTAPRDAETIFARAPIGRSFVNAHDVGLVAKNNWLNDACMNTYFELLAARNLSSTIANSLQIFKPFPSQKNPYSSFLKGNGTRPTSLDSDISPIYLPLNIRVHWALLVIKPATKTLHYYDSLSWQPALEVAKVRENLEWLTKTSWDLIVEPAPQQVNAYDCGVYVCHAADCLMQGVSLDVTPEAISIYRQKMHADFIEAHRLRLVNH